MRVAGDIVIVPLLVEMAANSGIMDSTGCCYSSYFQCEVFLNLSLILSVRLSLLPICVQSIHIL